MAQHEIMALGWLSQELANRAGDKLPGWFPQGPEWLELWDKAWDATIEDHGVSNDLADELVEQDGDSLQEDIRSAINRHSVENDSNTPDFILAQLLLSTLDAFTEAVVRRDEWYGIQPSPGGTDDQVMWLANDANPVE